MHHALQVWKDNPVKSSHPKLDARLESEIAPESGATVTETSTFYTGSDLTEDEVARLLGVTHFAEEEVDKHGPIPNTDEGTTNEALCRSGGGRAPDQCGILLLEFRFEIYIIGTLILVQRN